MWSTGTDGQGVAPRRLTLQTDGNVVVYDANNSPIWSSGTEQPVRVGLAERQELGSLHQEPGLEHRHQSLIQHIPTFIIPFYHKKSNNVDRCYERES